MLAHRESIIRIMTMLLKNLVINKYKQAVMKLLARMLQMSNQNLH